MRAVADWLATPAGSRAPVFYLGGYAGTGKTTLAMHLAANVARAVFLAYTGKAALVLQQRGCPSAQTIHSAIYRAQGEARDPKVAALRLEVTDLERQLTAEGLSDVDRNRLLQQLTAAQEALQKAGRGKRAQPIFGLREEGASILGADLVVVDECSMVGDRIQRDLLGFGIPVLALGDPFQLPPVGDGGGFTRGEPDFVLTEIHRHARESGVLRLATAIRDGDPIQDPGSPDCRVLPKPSARRGESLDPTALLGADQVIVGNNKTRRAFNHRYRQRAGLFDLHGPGPGPDDRVVCLRNDDRCAVPMLNGAQWRVKEAHSDFTSMRTFLGIEGIDQVGQDTVAEAHLHHFIGREEEIQDYEHRQAQEFTYAYALTAHKAQGSQWPKVVVWDESDNFRQYGYDPRRHLYTAVTRAQHDLTVYR
jgi:ATP-dependent exoDNAse (exonuclease V) alpha subunit